jgi:membrane-bound lytic murein transglycosylase A
MRLLLLICTIFMMTGCSLLGGKTDMGLTLSPAFFSELPGWRQDDFNTAMAAFENSCTPIKKRGPGSLSGSLPEAGHIIDWQNICITMDTVDQTDPAAIRAFLETHFEPFEVAAGKKNTGLFTGYYEASLRGSRVKQGVYRYPLHSRPDDLVMVNLGEFRDALKGQRIAGRISNGTLKPYEERAKIVNGDWPHDDEVLVWVDDPVDAFFVQIQGSGIIKLDDGGVMRIGYAGQNGHVYYAIGRELIQRGHLDKENVSLVTIREWLAENPDEADEVMNTNKSYVFFSEHKGLAGPIGGQGVALTAGRSLAIDRSLIPYGVPVWVDIDKAAAGGGDLRRLMITQDTGGAIRGPVRGDVFWGYGDRAESLAGPMKSQGRYWLLLPKSGDVEK